MSVHCFQKRLGAENIEEKQRHACKVSCFSMKPTIAQL